MNKCAMSVLLGMGLGIMIGYMREEEIDDFCRCSKRMRKNVKKQMHQIQDYLD